MRISVIGRGLAAAALLLLLLGCSGGDDDENTSSPDTTLPESAVAADGAPIVVGMYVPANVANFSTPEMIPMGEAAVEYINSELGGIAGRPIELVTCSTSGTPDSVAACANELLQASPVLVVGGPDAAASAGVTIFESAGVPIVGGGALTPIELTSQNRFVFQGFAAATVPGMAYLLHDELDVEQFTVLAPESPGTPLVVDLFLKPLTDALGLPTPVLVQVPLSTPDLTTHMFAAVDGRPDALMVLGLPCQPIMSAYASLGTDIPMILPENCSDPDLLGENAAVAEGVYFLGLSNRPDLDTDNADVRELLAALERHADGRVATTDSSLETFSSFMNIHAALDQVPDPLAISPTLVTETLRTQGPKPNFLKDSYDCAAPPTPILPGVCDASARLLRFEGGELTVVTDFVGTRVLWPAA